MINVIDVIIDVMINWSRCYWCIKWSIVIYVIDQMNDHYYLYVMNQMIH